MNLIVNSDGKYSLLGLCSGTVSVSLSDSSPSFFGPAPLLIYISFPLSFHNVLQLFHDSSKDTGLGEQQ